MDNSFIVLKYNAQWPCTKLHKGKQKDRTKTLAEFPDHILNDYGLSVCPSPTSVYNLQSNHCVFQFFKSFLRNLLRSHSLLNVMEMEIYCCWDSPSEQKETSLIPTMLSSSVFFWSNKKSSCRDNVSKTYPTLSWPVWAEKLRKLFLPNRALKQIKIRHQNLTYMNTI